MPKDDRFTNTLKDAAAFERAHNANPGDLAQPDPADLLYDLGPVDEDASATAAHQLVAVQLGAELARAGVVLPETVKIVWQGEHPGVLRLAGVDPASAVVRWLETNPAYDVLVDRDGVVFARPRS